MSNKTVKKVKLVRRSILKNVKDKSDKKNITFRLDARLVKAFEADCSKQEVSMTTVVSEMIANYLSQK